MKHLAILIVFMLFSALIHGQNQNKNYGTKAIYAFEHLRDTNNRTSFYKEEMLLMFNTKQTCFRSYQRYFDDSVFEYKSANPNTITEGDVTNFQKKKPFTTSEQIFTTFTTNIQSIVKNWIGTKLLIEELIPNLSWQINDSSKKINGLLCTKATCIFKGRNYIAWYSSSIPIKAGPWKLSGLPGLIVQVYDDKREVSWLLKSLYFSVDAEEFKLPNPIKKITSKEYETMIATAKADPIGYVKAAEAGMNNSDPNITITRDYQVKSGGSMQSKINNPIELLK